MEGTRAGGDGGEGRTSHSQQQNALSVLSTPCQKPSLLEERQDHFGCAISPHRPLLPNSGCQEMSRCCLQPELAGKLPLSLRFGPLSLPCATPLLPSHNPMPAITFAELLQPDPADTFCDREHLKSFPCFTPAGNSASFCQLLLAHASVFQLLLC